MIIWHMTNLSAGVSMVDSIVQCVWMNLIHSGRSTTGKSISLIVIEDSFPWVMSSGVTKSHFRKGKSVRKWPQKQKLRANNLKMLGKLKESQNGGFESYGEKHN
jgi:hypothetical protein